MRHLSWLLALAPVVAAAQNTPQEDVLGAQLAAQFERRGTVVDDPAIAAYVQGIAGKLAASAKLSSPLTLKVISGTGIYAACFPGGHCYVSPDLFRAASNEAEFASAIAHQIGHLAQPIPLIWPCQRRDMGPMGMAIPTGLLARQRDLEAQADILGLGYLRDAGYDPGALPDFFAHLPAPQPGSVARVFKVEAVPAATRTAADALRRTGPYVVDTSQFHQIALRAAQFQPKPGPNPPSLRAGR